MFKAHIFSDNVWEMFILKKVDTGFQRALLNHWIDESKAITSKQLFHFITRETGID